MCPQLSVRLSSASDANEMRTHCEWNANGKRKQKRDKRKFTPERSRILPLIRNSPRRGRAKASRASLGARPSLTENPPSKCHAQDYEPNPNRIRNHYETNTKRNRNQTEFEIRPNRAQKQSAVENTQLARFRFSTLAQVAHEHHFPLNYSAQDSHIRRRRQNPDDGALFLSPPGIKTERLRCLPSAALPQE